jgi:hypothetical protein
MGIRLCDADRERFGCEEWLDFDVRDVTVADLGELAERHGFDPYDWPEPFFGALTLDQAGDPDAKPRPPRWQGHAAVWMALRQNGCDVSWADAGTARIGRARSRPGPGKDGPPEEPSTAPEASTTTPSPSSSD